jgi:hypothetical protein
VAAGDEINVKIGAQNAGLLSGLKQAEDAVSHSTGYIRANLSGLSDVVERIKLPFVELAAILAGGVMFKSFVQGTEQLALELEKASQKTGITVENLGGLKFAAEQVDVSFESFTKSMQKLSLTLQQANEGAITPGAKALTAMGISAKDAAGNTKPLDELTGEIADKFKSYADGADKTALAMNLFGRAGAEMIPLLNQGSVAIEAAKDEAKAMGAVMSGEAVDAAVKFHESMGRVGLVGQALKISLGEALMPVLTLLANALADSGKEGGVLHEIILVLKDAMELLALAIIGITTSVRLLFDLGMFVFRELRDNVVGLGKAIWDALHGNFAAAGADLKITEAKMSQDFDTMVNAMVAHATAGGQAIAATLGKAGDPKKKGATTAAPHVPGIDHHMAELRKQWELEKAGYKLRESQAAESEDVIIGIKAEAAARALALFGANSTEYLAAETDLQNALNKEERDGEKIRREVLKAAAEKEKQALAERKRDWETLFSGIQRAMETSITGIIQGTTTASQAIKKLLQSVALEYINMGLKVLIAHKATELAKTGATAQGTAQRGALEQWAAIKSVALSAWSAIKSIGIYAIEGAAAAFKAIAAIPFVGPFLAPAAAVTAGIAIAGFAGHVASAEGGYDIPRGLNPMTQLHSNEMVLPSSLADKVRNMADGGSAGSGGGVHFHVNAIDGQSVKKFFVQHGDHILAVVKNGNRDFKLDS